MMKKVTIIALMMLYNLNLMAPEVSTQTDISDDEIKAMQASYKVAESSVEFLAKIAKLSGKFSKNQPLEPWQNPELYRPGTTEYTINGDTIGNYFPPSPTGRQTYTDLMLDWMASNQEKAILGTFANSALSRTCKELEMSPYAWPSKLFPSQTELDDETSKLKALGGQIEAKIKDLRGEIASLQDELAQKEHNIEGLKSHSSAAFGELDQKASELEATRQEIVQLKAALRGSEGLQAENEQLHSFAENLRAQAQSLEREKTGLVQKLQALGQELEKARAQIQEQKRGLEGWNELKTQLEQQLSATQSELAERQHVLEELHQSQQRLASENQALRQAVGQTQAQLAELSDKNRELNVRLAVQQASERDAKALTQELERARREAKQAQEAKQAIAQQLKDTSTQTEQALAKTSELEGWIATLTKGISGEEQKSPASDQSVTQSAEQATAQRAASLEHQKCKDSLAAALADKQKAEAEKSRLAQENAALEAENQDLKTQRSKPVEEPIATPPKGAQPPPPPPSSLNASTSSRSSSLGSSLSGSQNKINRWLSSLKSILLAAEQQNAASFKKAVQQADKDAKEAIDEQEITQFINSQQTKSTYAPLVKVLGQYLGGLWETTLPAAIVKART